MHPSGHASRASNADLNISFAPSPDYAGIAKAAAGGNLWAERADTIEALEDLLPKAVEAVLGGRGAVLDCWIGGEEGREKSEREGGGKAVLVG